MGTIDANKRIDNLDISISKIDGKVDNLSTSIGKTD